MSVNEQKMKDRGEVKIWSTIETKTGGPKEASSIQLAQQIILNDALRILPEVREWIEVGSAKTYRRDLKNYFLPEVDEEKEEDPDEKLLEKITQTFLFLAGTVRNPFEDQSNMQGKADRHKKVNTLKARILPELSFELAWRFLEVVINLSEYYTVEKKLNYNKEGFKWRFIYSSLLADSILDKLTLEAAEAFYPMPMREPPVDWGYDDEAEVLVGGYVTYQYEMVRASRTIDYSLYSKKTFDSVNYIQSQSWRINKDLLHQVKEDLKIPLKEDFVKAEYPDPTPCQWEIDLKTVDLPETEIKIIEDIRHKFRGEAELYTAEVGDYESAMGKYRAVRMATQIAEKYKDEVIYFPHSYDFRGRVYPIPVGLTPQGSDAVKALLEYAEGEPLNQDGAEWAFAYLASLYGDDKLSFQDRVKRGMELIEADYKDADEPYQFLAHQIELIKVVNDPSLSFKGRIHLDACNSGSQFTSAITGDKEGCIATNVIPTFGEDDIQIRKDAYLLVAEKAGELVLERIKSAQTFEEKEELEFFKTLLSQNGRKVCKTPVMVSNYGGTTGGRTDILWNMFREMKVDRKWIKRGTAARLSTIIGDSITGVLNGGKAFEKYIQQMNNAITKNNNAIWWTTKDGFHVVHVKNKELKSKQVSLLLPGSRKKTTIIKKIYSNNISVAKMRSAISPNYIHSLDAELLRRVAMKMKSAGIENSDWIHDSFGCHPNYVDEMLEITKKEFGKLVKNLPLKVLDAELRIQMKSRKKKDKEVLGKITIPQLRGFNTALGDLDVLECSEWFFS